MVKESIDILNEIKSGRIKIAQLSKETGIPAGRMYKWKGRGSKITSEDAEILKAWFKKMDNSLKNAPVVSLDAQSGHKTKKTEQPSRKPKNEFSDVIDMTTMTMKPSFGKKEEQAVIVVPSIQELYIMIIKLEDRIKSLQDEIKKANAR